jgi:hypothetical protein
VTAPGVYDIPNETYQADPALSASGAKLLLPPNCPAKYRQYRDHGEEANPVYEFGTAAHTVILGSGPPVTVVKHASWRSHAAQDEAEAARAEGAVPVLLKDWNTVLDMVEVLDAHPYASQLLNTPGVAEPSLFWPDTPTGVARRARPDYLHGDNEIIIDYKTCTAAHPKAIAAAMWNNGYYMQAPWYQDAVTGLGLLDYWPEFIFIFQEKTPPYLVTVVSPDEEMLSRGRQRNREAIDVFYRCTTFDHWPGYADDAPVTVSLPSWAIRELDATAGVTW